MVIITFVEASTNDHIATPKDLVELDYIAEVKYIHCHTYTFESCQYYYKESNNLRGLDIILSQLGKVCFFLFYLFFHIFTLCFGSFFFFFLIWFWVCLIFPSLSSWNFGFVFVLQIKLFLFVKLGGNRRRRWKSQLFVKLHVAMGWKFRFVRKCI